MADVVRAGPQVAARVLAGDAIIGTTPASAIKAVPVSWLWPDRIASGFLNLLAGPAGAGKSTTLYDLAARVSRDGGTVLIATAEDHLAAIVRPRLEAADADLERVHLVTDDLTLPDDLERLEARARQLDAVLVTCDPLVAFLNGGIDSHRDASVRQALRPLATMAERMAAAVVVVVHTNKAASDDPLFRISGSGGFSAAARHVLLACPDPDDETGSRRILAVVKSNLAPFPPALSYSITTTTIPGPDAVEIITSRVVWGEEIPGLDPRSLLAQPDRSDHSARDEAAAFLRDALADGPRPAGDVLREVAAAGISTAKGSLHRARQAAGVVTRKDGLSGGWLWELREGSIPIRGTLEPSPPPAETIPPNPKVPTVRDIEPSPRRGSRDDVIAALREAGLGRIPEERDDA